ncbi:MAG: hypothetical protein K0R98_1264 [Rickettsiaceae bacterium]|jgi:hypothetical protein|nr:hypothetical protein [Rickettsiaceae bacterium]
MRDISKNLFMLATVILVVTGCSYFSNAEKKAEYPKAPEDVRRDRNGKLTGDGFVLFGDKGDDEGSGKGSNVGIGINSYLWRATLETLSFMPMTSADPFGGVIITDWYEDPENKGERFKVNVVILDQRLRSNALKVSVFKQNYTSSGWRDSVANEKVALDIENKILTKARVLRVEKESSKK